MKIPLNNLAISLGISAILIACAIPFWYLVLVLFDETPYEGMAANIYLLAVLAIFPLTFLLTSFFRRKFQILE